MALALQIENVTIIENLSRTTLHSGPVHFTQDLEIRGKNYSPIFLLSYLRGECAFVTVLSISKLNNNIFWTSYSNVTLAI